MRPWLRASRSCLWDAHWRPLGPLWGPWGLSRALLASLGALWAVLGSLAWSLKSSPLPHGSSIFAQPCPASPAQPSLAQPSSPQPSPAQLKGFWYVFLFWTIRDHREYKGDPGGSGEARAGYPGVPGDSLASVLPPGLPLHTMISALSKVSSDSLGSSRLRHHTTAWIGGPRGTRKGIPMASWALLAPWVLLGAPVLAVGRCNNLLSS